MADDQGPITLAADVPSMKPGIFYGRRGAGVKVIKVYGTVAIVEDATGQRFPAPMASISGYVAKHTAPEQMADPAAQEPPQAAKKSKNAAPSAAAFDKPIINRGEPKKPASPTNQGTLFL